MNRMEERALLAAVSLLLDARRTQVQDNALAAGDQGDFEAADAFTHEDETIGRLKQIIDLGLIAFDKGER